MSSRGATHPAQIRGVFGRRPLGLVEHSACHRGHKFKPKRSGKAKQGVDTDLVGMTRVLRRRLDFNAVV